MTHSKDVREQILDIVPCIDNMCDKRGTTVGGTMDDPEPYQCQFCYELRFPAIDKIEAMLAEARIDEINKMIGMLEGHATLNTLFVPEEDLRHRIAQLSNKEEKK